MENSKKVKITFGIIVALNLILLFAIGLFVRVFNEYDIHFGVSDASVVEIQYGENFDVSKMDAIYSGSVIWTEEQATVEVTGNVDTSKLGEYKVVYKATYEEMVKEITVTYVVCDKIAPIIELVVNEDSYTSPKDKYIEEGFKATDNYDGDITDKVIREEKDGVVTYTVADSEGNVTIAERVIAYKDAVAPVITLNGTTDVSLNLGQEYVEEGFAATDDCDGEITDKVVVSGSIDISKPGKYILEYKVQDKYGNECIVNRNVVVADFEAPVISLNGDKNQYIKLGSEYVELGYSANDKIDGDVSDKVEITGSVDTSKIGLYAITYKVSDSAGNSTVVNREVYVYEKQVETNVVNPGKKVVYLTFDDGPGPYTKKLLDILDKYGVKATFFVCGQRPSYKNMIGEAHRRGHTIALHTYSHQYSIYTSEATYFADLKKIEDVCIAQTGVKPTIVRFPGGTSNTVSRKYCPGIMTVLSKSLAYHGYLYCDWNVSSGDAGGAKTKEEVANNVISGIKKNNVSIVLQHDTAGFSVDAVEQIVAWGLANGYTFLPMTENTPMYHHSANN